MLHGLLDKGGGCLSDRQYTEMSSTMWLQAGNFLDKIVTFCVGMGIGEGSCSLHASAACIPQGPALNVQFLCCHDRGSKPAAILVGAV